MDDTPIEDGFPHCHVSLQECMKGMYVYVSRSNMVYL
jgi:hypothetical protein